MNNGTSKTKRKFYRSLYPDGDSIDFEEKSELNNSTSPMDAPNTTAEEDGFVEEQNHKERSDFSGDESDDQWALASVTSWMSSEQKSIIDASESQAPRTGNSTDGGSESHRDLLQSMAPVRRPGVDSGEPTALYEDVDASTSDFFLPSSIRWLAQDLDVNRPIGEVKSLLDGESNLSLHDGNESYNLYGDDASASGMSLSSLYRAHKFESVPSSFFSIPRNTNVNHSIGKGEAKSLLNEASNVSLDDGYSSSLPYVDVNNEENFDALFLQGRPDPPGSLSSASDQQNIQIDTYQQADSDSSSSDANTPDADTSYCDTFQTILDQRLKGPFLSDELAIFVQRNKETSNYLSDTTILTRQKTLFVKSFSTAVDTTSDDSVDETDLSTTGQDKIQEIIKLRKLLLLIFVAFIVIFTAVSASSSTIYMASIPHDMPSLTPSSLPNYTMVPSTKPSLNPTLTPSQNPTFLETETIFYAVGDVPYHNLERIQLADRMRELPSDGDFVIHLGDIWSSGGQYAQTCQVEEYQEVYNILLQSKIPVFIIPGDNEWNDCPNPVDAKRFWRTTFHEFDRKWNHTFQVQRHPIEPENFFFVHKRTVYFGLALLGGRIRNLENFNNDLRAKFEYVKDVIDQYVVAGDAVNVVIFGHAFPVPHHEPFFGPLRQYIDTHLENKVPILYLNGDYHFYQSEKNYLGFSNFNRLQVAQGTAQPPLKVAVKVSNSRNATEAFSHDRMLWLSLS